MAFLLLLLVFLLAWGRRSREDALGSVSSRDLTGLWRQAEAGPLVGYLYFAGSGCVYYMASRIPASESMFTDKFKIADSYSSHRFSRWEFTAGRDCTGSLLLSVSGEAIGGLYYKVR